MVYPSPANSHFRDPSLLGTDFCHVRRLYKAEDYTKRRTKSHFGGEWESVGKNPSGGSANRWQVEEAFFFSAIVVLFVLLGGKGTGGGGLHSLL